MLKNLVELGAILALAFSLCADCEKPIGWQIRRLPGAMISDQQLTEALCEGLRQQDELRFWHHFTFDQAWTAVGAQDARLGQLLVDVYPDAFECGLPAPGKCAGVYINFFGHYIAISEKHLWGLTHEEGHWLWGVLYGKGAEVGHGTGGDPLLQMARAWLRFAYRYLPEGHSYWPHLATSDGVRLQHTSGHSGCLLPASEKGS